MKSGNILVFGVIAMLCPPIGACAGKPVDFDASAAGKSLRPVTFSRVPGGLRYQALVGKRELTVENADNPDLPKLWDSPIWISDSATGKTCSTEPWIVRQVFASEEAAFAIVLTVEASLQGVYFIDLGTCNQKYPPITAATERIDVSGSTLTIHPACECVGNNECLCSAAREYGLNPGFRPTLDQSRSDAVTQAELGITFRGSRWIRNPKTPRAELLKGRSIR